MRNRGLEPRCLATLEPESSASTNSASSAQVQTSFVSYTRSSIFAQVWAFVNPHFHL